MRTRQLVLRTCRATVACTHTLSAQGPNVAGRWTGIRNPRAASHEHSLPLAPASSTDATTPTWIRMYGHVLDDQQFTVTPEDIQTTPDGGYIVSAASSTSPSLLTWLVKLDSSGSPLWQQEVGCPVFRPAATPSVSPFSRRQTEATSSAVEP